MGTPRPPPPQLLHVIFPVPLQVLQPRSPSLHRLQMQSTTPVPWHVSHSGLPFRSFAASCDSLNWSPIHATVDHAANVASWVTMVATDEPPPRAVAPPNIPTVTAVRRCFWLLAANAGRSSGKMDSLLTIGFNLFDVPQRAMPAGICSVEFMSWFAAQVKENDGVGECGD